MTEDREKASDKVKNKLFILGAEYRHGDGGRIIKRLLKTIKSVRPDVEVELISQPVSGYQEWIKTRFASDQAPTIESNHATVIGEQYKQGLTVDLKEALEGENPYDKK